MSLISAISDDRVIANQVIEGAVDGALFENFIYHTLVSIRNDKDLCEKKVLLLLDNARIHKTAYLYDTIKKMKAIAIFNSSYSPWLNPVEQLFKYIKSNMKEEEIRTK
jgi:transposase